LHHAQGRLDESVAESEAALALARAIGHIRLECIVRCNLGLVCFSRRSWPEAQAHHEAALTLARELNDRRSEGLFLGYLGQALARVGRFDQARSSVTQGEQLLRQVEDKFSLGLLMCHRAEVEHLAGAYDAASAALRLARKTAASLSAEGDSELTQAISRAADLLGSPLRQGGPKSAETESRPNGS
jgi:tetratricopeptide (TPR) repeat protein